MITEKTLEIFCKKETTRRGGKALKWSSPSQRGVPDRIIILPGGKIGFIELKGTGKKPTKLQAYYIKYLMDSGCKATFCDSKQSVMSFLDTL